LSIERIHSRSNFLDPDRLTEKPKQATCRAQASRLERREAEGGATNGRETRDMLFFLATTVAAVASPAPSALPAPSPSQSDENLKEIGRVRSTLYCSVLAKRIAPTLLGLMKTDEAIGAGHRVFAKMSDDTVMGSPNHLDMDRRYLSQVVTIATHNLQVVKKLLSDPAYFKTDPKTADERSANDLKAKLQAVAADQNTALNLLAGALETDLMGQMQSQRDNQMAGATGQENSTPAPEVDSSQFMSVAGLPDNDPLSQYSQKNLSSGKTLKHTVYDSLNIGLEDQQRRIAGTEKIATQAVIDAVPLCTSKLPDGSPAPEPSDTPTPMKTPIPIIIKGI